MKKCTGIFVFSLLILLNANQTVIAEGFGSTPKIDGVLSESELKDTFQGDLAGGGKVFYKNIGSKLYVGVRGIKFGISHVCVTDGKAIYVLHASGALGKAVFQNKDKKWNLTENFKWELRDKTLSAEAIKLRNNYFDKNGWVANTGGMGNKTEMEYIISEKFIDSGKFRFAVVYIDFPENNKETPKDIHYYPSDIKDDSKLFKLIAGDPPNVLNFDTSTWATFKKASVNENSLLQAVKLQNAKFAELTSKQNFKSAAGIYTENGQLLQPNGMTITGRKGIAEYWKATFASGVNEIKVVTKEVEGKGDMLYEIGSYEAYIKGGQLVDDGKFIVIWKKVNGDWLRHKDIWNSNRKAQ